MEIAHQNKRKLEQSDDPKPTAKCQKHDKSGEFIILFARTDDSSIEKYVKHIDFDQFPTSENAHEQFNVVVGHIFGELKRVFGQHSTLIDPDINHMRKILDELHNTDNLCLQRQGQKYLMYVNIHQIFACHDRIEFNIMNKLINHKLEDKISNNLERIQILFRLLDDVFHKYFKNIR